MGVSTIPRSLCSAFEEPSAKTDLMAREVETVEDVLVTCPIMDPLDTRTWISMGIEAASQSPATREFNIGVLQT